MIVTPAQLLLAIAEHETLERTCAVLGLDLETARKLLRGAVVALRTEAREERPPKAAKASETFAKTSETSAKKTSDTFAKTSETAMRVFSDGAARGNPGPAGAGAVLTDSKGNVLARLGRYLGRQTNNVAEYQGLLIGLRRAQEMGAPEIEVRADSQLMIRQLKGEYAVRNAALKPLHAEALRLLRSFGKYGLQHIPRAENSLADEMSNRAIDEEMS
ncbi:MAG TPA: ribonuclease HI family protein [Myxococcales bacterium]|nr:ribonuclease HI family protein [Myxococcales bacterium]